MNYTQQIKSLAAAEEARKEGRHMGSAPYGYFWAVRGNGKGKHSEMRVDIRDSEIVRHAFLAYSSGQHTLESLAKHLLDKFDFSITKSGLHRLLKNKFYVGFIVCRRNGFEEEFPHIYPQIVSMALYNKAQEQFSQGTTNRPRFHGYPYKYRGLMRCEVDGLIITPEKHKGHVYYHCTQSMGKHKAPWINEKVLEKLFDDLIKKTVKENKVKNEFNDLLGVIAEDTPTKQERVKSTVLFRKILFSNDKQLVATPYSSEEILKRLSQYSLISESKKAPQSLEYRSINDLARLLLGYFDEPRTIDQLVVLSGAELNDIQNVIIDMQIEGMIDQNHIGQWIKL